VATFLAWPARPVSAAGLTFISQSGTVSATADGTTVTDTLPQFQSGNISVTAGTLQTGMDYALATAQSTIQARQIHLLLTASVGDWGHKGIAESTIVAVFSVSQNTPFEIDLERAEGTGAGWLGYRAFITLSNDAGIIFRRNVGAGFDSCNYEHPDGGAICESGVLAPDEYHFEMRASAHAPTTCGTCKGFAVTSETELRLIVP